LWRGKLWEQRWLLRVFVLAVIGPYLANQAGWVAAEVGRQPWVVYGLLKTSDAVSPSVKGGEVLTSIVLFGIAYLALFALWIYVLNEKIQHGPEDPDTLGAPPSAGSFVEAAVAVGDRSLTESEASAARASGGE
jgi:cytochrome d ubiquinol oxidase subunit I